MAHPRPIRAFTASVVAAAVLALGACGSDGSQAEPAVETTTSLAQWNGFSGYVKSPPVDVSAVTMPSVDDATVEMVAEPGGLLVVYFGFASCPDICPMTFNVLRQAVANQPEADRARVQVAFVTVDPTRDTAELLGNYLDQFFPDGHALRSDDPVELRTAVDAFGAAYKISLNDQGQREVSHSDELYVVDDTGTVILAWPFGLTPEVLTADLAHLLDGERPAVDS